MSNAIIFSWTILVGKTIVNRKKGRVYLPFFIFISSLFATACDNRDQYFKISGHTMGTNYQVTLENPSELSINDLEQSIQQKLEHINQLMSTYLDNSELSVFNQTQTKNCQSLSKETYFVVEQAIAVSKQTHGKFDITLAPLIELWGFDKKQTNDRIPEKTIIENILNQIGYQKLMLGEGCISKAQQELSINLSAIAKGYAVDQVASLIREAGVNNYLVEIGGEIANSGVNPNGLLWTIAIESVDGQSKSEQAKDIQKIILPMGLGVATSGDYRNYFEKDAKRYSHMIDPTTGYPIIHNLASVTVLHPETLMADAYATAMMIMGKEKALDFANENKIPIFMLVKQDQSFIEVYNDAFKGYIK